MVHTTTVGLALSLVQRNKKSSILVFLLYFLEKFTGCWLWDEGVKPNATNRKAKTGE